MQMMEMMRHRRAHQQRNQDLRGAKPAGLDITGLAASPLTFPDGLACHGRSSQLVKGNAGVNVVSLLTGGEQAKC